MGLVGERKRGGTDTVKTRDHIVKGRQRVGKRSRSGGRKEAVLQQESVVTVEIHQNLEGDVGIAWFPALPLPFSSVEFIVTVVVVVIVIVGLTVAREYFSETF